MVCLERGDKGEMEEMESENSRWRVRNDVEPFGFSKKNGFFIPTFFHFCFFMHIAALQFYVSFHCIEN